MNSYGFGNYLTALRESSGLSQYQLGRLVGVSDKAVSKWENGNSRPRLSICEKLAALYHLSIDDLFCLGEAEPNEGEEAIWDKCRKHFIEHYGDHAPIAFRTRLEAEITAFRGKGIARLIDVLSIILNADSGSKRKLTVQSYVKSSFAAWLMGITDINPLTPHYLCPNCKHTEIHISVKDGWDLEEKKCSCGCLMHREGHNIPFSILLSKIRHNALNADIRMQESEFDSAYQIINSYFSEKEHIIAIALSEEEMLPPKRKDVPCYVVVKGKGNGKEQNGIQRLPFSRYQELTKNNLHFNFVPNTCVIRYQDAPSPEQVITKENLERALHFMLEKQEKLSDKSAMPSISEIAAFVQTRPVNMTLLMRIMGLSLTAFAWTKAGKEQITGGRLLFDELPYCAEEIWLDIVHRMKNASWFEISFADQVLDQLRYPHEPMDKTVTDALLDLGYSPDMITYLDQIVHLWPKEAILWRLLNEYLYPAYFNETTSNSGKSIVRYLP